MRLLVSFFTVQDSVGLYSPGWCLTASLLYAFACLCVLASLCALLIGYISAARFITYQLVWMFIILSGFYLLVQLFNDTCEHLFSPKSASGKALKQVLGMGDTRLEQASVILSGLGRAGLILLAIITLFVGGDAEFLPPLGQRLIHLAGHGA